MTTRVVESLRAVSPRRVYVAADGPRTGQPGEEELCARVRDTIQAIDWDCDVRTLFREENLGCRRAVSSAIDWLFENEEEGIILEDDCVADPSFFRFCTELLEKYRDNDRVMTINGGNFQFGIRRGDASYFFARCPHVSGWATWRRSWRHFDLEMKTWPDFFQHRGMEQAFTDRRMRQHFSILLHGAHEGKIDSWAYPLLYMVLHADGLCITPNTNLVENVGWDSGTHTRITGSSWLKRITMGRIYRRFAENKAEPIDFPLKHPETMTPVPEADIRHFRQCLDTPFMWLHVRLKLGLGPGKPTG